MFYSESVEVEKQHTPATICDDMAEVGSGNRGKYSVDEVGPGNSSRYDHLHKLPVCCKLLLCPLQCCVS